MRKARGQVLPPTRQMFLSLWQLMFMGHLLGATNPARSLARSLDRLFPLSGLPTG